MASKDQQSPEKTTVAQGQGADHASAPPTVAAEVSVTSARVNRAVPSRAHAVPAVNLGPAVR